MAFSQVGVGINTTNPQATLDIVSKTATPANKIINVQNSNATDSNNLSIYEDSRTYIGKPDSVTPDATNDALVNIYGNVTRSALKLVNPPLTQDKQTGNIAAGVNYDRLSPAYIDVNGNIVKGYDVGAATSLNFDGSYSLTTTGLKITDISPSAMLTFKIYTGLVFGPAGTGSSILATANFGINTGFTVSNFASGSGSGSTRYAATATAVNNGNTTISAFTSTLTFAFGTGSSLEFYYQNNAIYARVVGGTTGSILIFESKRFR
ncbi:hypothetical protein CW752_02960 [Chryseobacterium sp. PMSZPI]|nr:hypothetical protein CW752_02960 [Chryseobacterium sp. PMSZPI]